MIRKKYLLRRRGEFSPQLTVGIEIFAPKSFNTITVATCVHSLPLQQHV